MEIKAWDVCAECGDRKEVDGIHGQPNNIQHVYRFFFDDKPFCSPKCLMVHVVKAHRKAGIHALADRFYESMKEGIGAINDLRC